jgi:hypothetical protein
MHQTEDAVSNLLLDEWATEAEAATAIGKTVRTLRHWRRKGVGPPYALFGRTVKYRKTALVEHYRVLELHPVHSRSSRRR